MSKQIFMTVLSAIFFSPSAFAIDPSHFMPFQCSAVIQEAAAHLKWKADFDDLRNNPPLQTEDRVVGFTVLFHDGLDRINKLQSLGAIHGAQATTADAQEFLKKYRRGILGDSYSITTMRAQVTLFESVIDQALDQAQRQHLDCAISHAAPLQASGVPQLPAATKGSAH